jgi:hypothetical protein
MTAKRIGTVKDLARGLAAMVERMSEEQRREAAEELSRFADKFSEK